MTATATNPIWVVKTRLQLEAKHQERVLANEKTVGAAARAATIPGKPSIGMLPALTMTKQILASEGLKGLYKGMSASYLGVTEGVIQWVLYEVRTSPLPPWTSTDPRPDSA